MLNRKCGWICVVVRWVDSVSVVFCLVCLCRCDLICVMW